MRGKTVLIEGSDGWMGRILAQRFRESGARVLTTSRRAGSGDKDCSFLDLEQDVRAWRPPGPVDVAVLCAAVTSLKKCKDDPAGTSAVNVRNTLAVASTLLDAGAFVVFPSTNLVFNGTVPYRREEAEPCPVSEYGRQKAEAERKLLDLDARRVALMRFTKVLGPGLALFDGWVQSLRAGQEIRPFEDYVMAPVSLGFAVGVVLRVAEARAAGVVHVSADRDVTYAEAARQLAGRMSVDGRLVAPVRSGDPSAPRHTVLDVTRMKREFGIQAPPVTEALEAVIAR
jgi:dTDP-4-dehydrorhamnose reductase